MFQGERLSRHIVKLAKRYERGQYVLRKHVPVSVGRSEYQPIAVVGVVVTLSLAFLERSGVRQLDMGAPRGVVAVELVFAAVEATCLTFI